MWVLFGENVCKNERIGFHGSVHLLWGCGPLTRMLFGENVCKNERIGSHVEGVRLVRPLDPPMYSYLITCVALELNLNNVVSLWVTILHVSAINVSSIGAAK